MNTAALAEVQTTAELALPDATPSEIMMNAPLLAQIDQMAKRMATAEATIPKHLRGNEGDCWAVIMQAVQWRMNPFVVAQKTHLVNGQLGYEAQLVHAVVKASGAIDGSLKYEYKGEGNDLECRAGGTLKGEIEVTWGEWLKFSSVTVKNSPLWKTNPRQQMAYLQAKNWVRLYCPEALLGIYTDDELRESNNRAEREVGPRASSLNAELRGDGQAKPPAGVAEPVIEGEAQQVRSELTFAQAAEAIRDSTSKENLSKVANTTVLDFLAADGNERFREELTKLYKARQADFDRAEEETENA